MINAASEANQSGKGYIKNKEVMDSIYAHVTWIHQAGLQILEADRS